MNNPGMDPATWQGLTEKWAGLRSAGHTLEIEFRLIADAQDEENILAIDVIQSVDEEVVTQTVQRNAEEAYPALGIAGLSLEQLVELYKEIMAQVYRQARMHEASVVVTMSTSSPLSGEVRGHIETPDPTIKNGFPVNYKHYYILHAIRGKMVALLGDGWHTARAVYRFGGLEFYFEY